jgi:hypothetical protein
MGMKRPERDAARKARKFEQIKAFDIAEDTAATMRTEDVSQPPTGAKINIPAYALKDLICDELYAFADGLDVSKVVTIPHKEVGALAERVARRCIIGH